MNKRNGVLNEPISGKMTFGQSQIDVHHGSQSKLKKIEFHILTRRKTKIILCRPIKYHEIVT